MTLGHPPPGTESNFVNPHTLSKPGHIAMIFLTVLAAIFVSLRLYVKAFITKLWGWDDLFCCLACISILVVNIISMTIMGSGHGRFLGIHDWDVRLVDITVSTLQGVVAFNCLYSVAALFVKLSLFHLYLRLFKIRTISRWLIYIGMAACVVCYTAVVIVLCIWLVPPPDRTGTAMEWFTLAWQAYGARNHWLAITQASFGTLSDIYLLIIPVQSVLALRLSLAKRVGVILVFSTGILAIGCSIGSLVCRINILHTTDGMWESFSVLIFSSAELTAGIICSSTPICAALFRSEQCHSWASRSKHFFSRFRLSKRSTEQVPPDDPCPMPISLDKRQRAKAHLDTDSCNELFVL